MNPLCRLENTTAPAGQERAGVEAILAARRLRFGASYEPLTFPPESYAGCRTVADRSLRSRKLTMECKVAEARVAARRPGARISV